MATTPSIPKGTRDFLPEQSLKRQFIFDTARKVFQQFGYVPIETPAMENTETLLGKYGEEGDKLIYRILDNGDLLDRISISQEELKWWTENVHTASDKVDFHLGDILPMYLEKNMSTDSASKMRNSQIANSVTSRALRYDLTVPFARFVVQNQNELSFPFKRFQIQPVWRADRPQKGRYREFYQCDVDVIGSDSLLNEAELLTIIDNVFTKLGLGDIVIRLNNRKILSGIATAAGIKDKFMSMTIAIDKLDKIGADKVKEEMMANGIPESAAKKVLNLIKLKGKTEDTLRMLAGAVTGVEEAYKGIEEIKTVLKALPESVRNKVELDLTLARGLNYYTGAIIEVGHKDFNSSICGGGRYDNLTGIFGLDGMSGVGVSFGADRIYDLMEAKALFPASIKASSDVLFVNFGQAEAMACLALANEIRSDEDLNFSAEVYPDAAKMKKQMKYADSKGIRFVMMIGSEELANKQVSVKDMKTGEQQVISQNDLLKFLKNKLED